MILHSQEKMKILPLFVGLLIGAISVTAQFDGCDLKWPTGEEIGATIIELRIADIADGVILELITENVNDIIDPENDFLTFKFSATDNTFEVTLSENYANVEQLLPSKPEQTLINAIFVVICEKGSNSLYVDITIVDENNQPTELTEEVISYNIPLPLPAKIPLYLFSNTPGKNELTARDADLTNDIIKFKIEPANIFSISGEKEASDPLGKTYVATISTIQPLTKLEVNEFIITAEDKDSREPATKTISITVDEASSLPQPLAFGKNYYEGKYVISDEGVHSLEVENLVLANAGSNTITAKLDHGGIIGEYFSATVQEGFNIVLNKENDLIPEILDENDYLTVWVEAQYADFDIPSTSVSVVITLPAKEQPGNSAFTETLYKASYDVASNEVDLDVPIIVIDIPDLIFDLVGAHSEYFLAEPDKESPSNIIITLPNPLPNDVIEDNVYISLILKAKSIDETNYGSTVVVIDLPKTECSITQSVFSSTLYKSTYSIPPEGESEHTITTEVIAVNSEVKLNVVIEPNAYPDYLTVKDDDPLNIELVLNQNLAEETLDNNDVISLVLVAKSEDGNIYGSSVVIIDLPPGECPAEPTEYAFGKSLYEGDYDITGVIILTEEITAAASELLQIEFKTDFPEYFEVTYEAPPKVEINVLIPIPEEVIEENKIMTLVLSAKGIASSQDYGETGVVIKMPSTSATDYAFGKSLYEGEYDITGVIILTEEITAAASELLQIEFKTDFPEYFEVTYEAPPKVEINVLIPIPEEVIEENKIMTLVLSAKAIASSKDYGETGVVIKMPSTSETDNAFGQTLYKGTYSISAEGTHSVTFDEEITATPQTGLEIKFDDPEFEKYFTIDHTDLTNVLITVVPTGLPAEILEQPFLTLLLNAKSQDDTDYGQTGLVISLPEQECVIEPSNDIFSSTVFDGEYKVTDTGDHELTTDTIYVIPDGVVVTIAGDYAKNFEAIVAGKVVTLSIVTELTEDVWKDNRYISLLLQGTSGALTGAARVILALPEPDCEDPTNPTVEITFLDAVYTIAANHKGNIEGPLIATFDPAEAHTFAISNNPSWVILTPPNYLTVPANSQLRPETIKFTATVTGDVSGESKRAQVTINVLPNIDGEAKTAYSMQVVEIDEEHAALEILLLNDVPVLTDTYKYVIKTQEPAVPEMFIIDPTTKYLTSIEIDREDDLFEGMGVPQVVLTIGLEKITSKTANTKSLLASHPLFKHMFKRETRNAQEYKQCLMLEKEVLRVDSIMHVPVIIKDLNDSPPKFSTLSIVVGYPTKDNVLHINPPYLLKAEATDADEGDNAIIRYSCASTSVIINEATGVVYPTEGLYNAGQDQTLIITASDGVNEANPAFTAKIVLLDEAHISVLGFPNIILEDLETTLQTLSDKIEVTLRALSAGSLPGSSATTVRADSDFHLKAIVYGIDNNDAAITHESLKAKLVGEPVTIIEYIPPGTVDPGTSGGDEECDDTGLIAGISVLAVALAVCIVAFIVFYFKKKKNNASLDLEQLPEFKTSFKKQSALQNGLDTDVELKDVATRRPTQYPMEGPKIDPDSSAASSTSSEDGEDFDEARDRRKSVTFNEKTQHFDITAKETDSAKADYIVNKES